LNNYHSWGDDFSLYLNQAHSLIDGTYHKLLKDNRDMMDKSMTGPDLYPIVYPMILAPVMYFAGPEFLYCKVVTFFFFLVALFYFEKINRLLNVKKVISLLSISALLFCPLFIFHHNQILSDIPSLAFSMISVYYYLKGISRNWVGTNTIYSDHILSGIFISLAIFTRSANLMILFAMVLVSFYKNSVREKKTGVFIRQSITLIFFTVLLYCLNSLLPLSRSANEVSKLFESHLISNILHHLVYYAVLLTEPLSITISDFISHTLTILNIQSHHLLAIKVGRYMVFFFYLIIGWGVRSRIRNLSTEQLFIVFSSFCLLCLYIIWPKTQGPRFVFFIYPFLFVLLFTASDYLSKGYRYPALILLFLLISSKGIATMRLIINKEKIFKTYEKESIPGSVMFHDMQLFIRDSLVVGNDKVIGCNKPRMLYYFTGKKSYLLSEKNIPFMDYILIRDNIDQDFITNYGRRWQSIKHFGMLSLYSRNSD